MVMDLYIVFLAGVLADYQYWSVAAIDLDNVRTASLAECMSYNYPDSKVHGANMGPTWGLQDPGGPHIDPM